MRSAWIVLVVMLSATSARADATADIDSLVRREAQSIIDPKVVVAYANDRVVVMPSGSSMDMVMNFYGAYASKISHKVESVLIGIDPGGHAGWFHAVVTAHYTLTDCGDGMDDSKCKPPVPATATWRVNGVARDDHGWQIAAVMWSRVTSDKALLAHVDATATKPGAPTLTGDSATGQLVANWFTGGSITADESAGTTVAANGTAPTEMATGTGVGKLVKEWDGLKLWTDSVNTTAWGTLGFATATVWLPVKGRGAAKMVLGAVLVKSGNAWKWVSLNFSPPLDTM
jgi:hypothetical protein